MLWIFNVVYNSFRARVYFTEKFFLQNVDFEKKIVDELKKKLDNSGDSSSSNNENQIENNQELPQNTDCHETPPERFNQPPKNKKSGFAQYADEENPNEIAERNVNIEMASKNKNESLDLANITFNKIAQKKNSFKFNFLEYCLHYLFCFRKSEKVKQKISMLENSEDFYDYYLDINNYIKKMIEIDFIKLIVFRNEDRIALDYFTPSLKTDYSLNYLHKIQKLYSNNFSIQDQEEFLNSISNMKIKDKDFIEKMLSFYKK
jgi:hypothetical protein